MTDPRSLTASQIMSSEVVTLSADMPVDEALSTLEDQRISGAPVVDAGGRCVGIFTSADVIKRDVAIQDGETPRAGDYFASDPFDEDLEFVAKEDYDERILGRDTVGQWMSTDVETVEPKTSLERVCRKMVDGRIHRVLVIADGKVQGIISTIDIVRLLAAREPAAKPAAKRRQTARKQVGGRARRRR